MTIRGPGRLVDLDEAHGGTELMAEQLQQISDSVKTLMRGRLTEKAIIILIRELLPHGMKLGPNQIKAVLDAAQNLDKYTKKGT